MSLTDVFTVWLSEIRPDLDKAFELLKKPLSDQPAELLEDLVDIEAWNARVGLLLAEADSWLDRAKAIYLLPKEEGRTEIDRKVLLDKAVADIKQIRDTVERISESIKTRISLGQSLIKFHSQFLEANREIK